MKKIIKLCLGISTLSLAACTTMEPAGPWYAEKLETRCTFGECVRCDLQGMNLVSHNLMMANLADANLFSASLEKANLERASLVRANLAEANLTLTNFERADLAGANVMGAIATEANFERATLDNANFSGADLRGANFERAFVVGTMFDGANLKEANFFQARMTPEMKASLHHHGAKNLDTVVLIRYKPHKGHKHSRTPRPHPTRHKQMMHQKPMHHKAAATRAPHETVVQFPSKIETTPQ